MSNNITEGDQSYPHDRIEALGEIVEQQQEQIGLLNERIDDLRENTVHTIAVKRVLLEYGISPELVDEVIENVETVDDELWGDDGE